MIDYKDLANSLLDTMCDQEGVNDTLRYLFGLAYSKEEMLELNFQEYDIKNAAQEYLQELQEEYEENLNNKNLNPSYISWRNNIIESKIKELKEIL